MVSQITFNLVQGSVRFNFSPDSARALQQALGELTQSLKAVSAAPAGGRRQPQKSMEYQYTGDVFLEVFCNPNIWPSPFAAKLLLTLRDDRVRLTTEAALTQILEDLSQFLEQTA